MNFRKVLLMLLVLVIGASVFAAETHDIGVQVGAGFGVVDDKFSFVGGDIQTSETAYFYTEDSKNAPIFKFTIGAGMTGIGEDKHFGLTAGAFGGYSFGIGSLIKVDVAGGVQAFESSAIAYLVKKTAKEEYKISTFIAPAVDVSAWFGLDVLAVRAGVRGAYQISKAFGNAICVTPYVSVSGELLKILNIL